MKRLIFFALMMVCSVSWAKWELSSSDEDQMIFYDKSTIRKNGVMSRMWVMLNYSKVQTDSSGNSWMSTKSLHAHNCRDETVAIISAVQYSGSMGKENVVSNSTWQERELEWMPIIPGSTGRTLWKIACGKK